MCIKLSNLLIVKLCWFYFSEQTLLVSHAVNKSTLDGRRTKVAAFKRDDSSQDRSVIANKGHLLPQARTYGPLFHLTTCACSENSKTSLGYNTSPDPRSSSNRLRLMMRLEKIHFLRYTGWNPFKNTLYIQFFISKTADSWPNERAA